MRLLRSLLSLALIAAVVYVGFTVPLGQKTLFGHLSAIWSSDQARELVDGVKESSGPMVDKLGRAVSAGVEEARRDGAARDEPAPAANERVDAGPAVPSELRRRIVEPYRDAVGTERGADHVRGGGDPGDFDVDSRLDVQQVNR